MKIQAKYMVADTQVFTGKGYYIGSWVTSGKTCKFYNIETSGSVANANMVACNVGQFQMLPLPGVECSNGLYAANSDNACLVYYAI